MKRVVALILTMALMLAVGSTAMAGKCSEDGCAGGAIGGGGGGGGAPLRMQDLTNAQLYRNAQLDYQIKRAQLFNARVEVVKNVAWLGAGVGAGAYAVRRWLRN